MELNFGYVARYAMCRLWTKNCTKLLSISFIIIYFVLIPRFTFSKFTMILGLIEIFIPELCLVLNVFA
jgi:hypothetical protein